MTPAEAARKTIADFEDMIETAIENEELAAGASDDEVLVARAIAMLTATLLVIEKADVSPGMRLLAHEALSWCDRQLGGRAAHLRLVKGPKGPC